MFDDNIGEKTGWFGFMWTSGNSVGSDYFVISGYPYDHQYHQYKMSGQLTKKTDRQLFYTIDTTEGQSGSPIFYRYIAFGIHNVGYDSTVNAGVRITESLYNYFKEFKTE